MRRFGILISGRGSNMQALLQAHAAGTLPAQPAVVIHNRADAGGAVLARDYGVPTEWVAWQDPAVAEARVIELGRQYNVDFLVLAGFMRVVRAPLIQAFPRRMINIHPSLLPAFPGLHAQRQALEYGAKVTGCTTHFVDEGVDTGPIIMQRTLPIKPDDTEASLSERLLAEEHRLLVDTVTCMAQDRLHVDGRIVHVRAAAE